MIYELNHFGIVVKDLQKSIDFYQNVLGAKVVYRGFIPGNKTDVIYLLITGGMVELLHRADAGPDEKFGITHIAFMTDDLEGDYARLIDAGNEGLVAPRVAGSGAGRLAFLRDPNGTRVELLQRDIAMRDEPVKHDIIKAFDHYSLFVKDRDAAVNFYKTLLGMKELKRLQVASTGLDMTYLNYDYDVLELLTRPGDAPDDIYLHFALRVDDIDKAMEAFAAHGLTPLPGTPRPAATGLGRVVMYADPDGVKFEIVDRADLRTL